MDHSWDCAPLAATFASFQALIEYGNEWSNARSIKLLKYSKPWKNSAGEIYKYYWECNRSGKPRPNAVRTSKKLDCPMRVIITAVNINNVAGQWEIRPCSPAKNVHNHPPDNLGIPPGLRDISSFIARLPKCELHMHLEGSLEPSLVSAFAVRNNVPVPASSLDLDGRYNFHDLTSFLAVYYPNMAVLQTAEDFYELAWTYLCKCKEQNVLHTEMFFDPQAHTSRGVSFGTVIGGYRRAIVKAERELGVSGSLIMCFLRDWQSEFAMATLMEALPYKDWIVGVGLDSDERGHPPIKFMKVFERAKQEGLLVTAHADIDQVNSIEHIRQLVYNIQVDRIDHGTNIVEDAELVRVVRMKGLGLTCCPISNGIVTSDFKGKEIAGLLKYGVKVTVNSDDPAYFKGYMNENMLKMAKDASLTEKDLVQLSRNAFEIAWISTSKRAEYLAKLDEFERLNESLR